MSVVIEEFKPVIRNTLRGFARVRFQSGLVMHEVGLHISHGKAWASPPSRQMIDREGRVMRDEAGKPRWQELISFSSRPVRDSWSAQIVAAVQEAHPDALRDAVSEQAS